MLFSISTGALKYSDVMEFVAQNHREGIGLDYKEAIPKGLEKTICAMANTYGGTIIIGVKDNDGYPDPKSKGIALDRGIEERITRIAVDNIFPPVIPEVGVCDDNGLCFVVIRVPQGRETPYTVRRNQVYIRTGNVNTPDDLATLDRIEWLTDGRRKAAELRKTIIRAMASRANNRLTLQDVKIPFGVVSMSFGPIHPYEALFTDQEMPLLREQISVSAYGMSLPGTASASRTVQGGMSYFEHHKPTNDFNYFELNRFGYLYFLEDMGVQKLEKNASGELEVKEKRFEPYRLIRAADMLLNVSRKLYALKRYPGDLRLTVQADKLFKIPVHPFPGPNRWMMGDEPKESVDDQLLWFQDWSQSDLENYDLRISKLLELGKEVTYSFGFPEEENLIRGMLTKYSPKHGLIAKSDAAVPAP